MLLKKKKKGEGVCVVYENLQRIVRGYIFDNIKIISGLHFLQVLSLMTRQKQTHRFSITKLNLGVS